MSRAAGVARQYCGRLGKVANCPAGMFLAYVSPLGRALVDKRLYLPESWTADKDRCAAAAVPEERVSYRSKTELALELGNLRAGWVAGDDAFGMSPSFREGLAALGTRYVLPGTSSTTVWPLEPSWTSPDYPGFRRPRKPRLVDGQLRTMEQRSAELPDEAWRELTVAEGSQGPRSYRFSGQRVRPTSRRRPAALDTRGIPAELQLYFRLRPTWPGTGAAPLRWSWLGHASRVSCVSLRVSIWELYTVPTYPGRIRCSVIAEGFTYAGRSGPRFI